MPNERHMAFYLSMILGYFQPQRCQKNDIFDGVSSHIAHLVPGDGYPVVVKDVHVLVEAEVAVLVLVRLRERLLHLVPLPAVEPLLEHLFANNIVATVSKIMLLETNNLLHFNEVRFARIGFAEFASL